MCFTHYSLTVLFFFVYCYIASCGETHKILVVVVFILLSFNCFFCPFLKQGSLSSETELSQFFSHDVSSHTFLSESMLMSSHSDEALHQHSCRTSVNGSSSQPHGNMFFIWYLLPHFIRCMKCGSFWVTL